MFRGFFCTGLAQKKRLSLLAAASGSETDFRKYLCDKIEFLIFY